MDEYKKNFLDLSEIDRIQQEIERNLYRKPQSDNDGMTDANKYANADSPPGYYVTGSPAPSMLEQRAAPASNVFYHETVKNESKRNKKKKFRRNIIFTIIICTIGTCILGMGLGITYPYIRNLLFPGISNEKSGNYINASGQAAAVPQTNAVSAEDAVVVNTISDVIKLVAPSIVSINSIYSDSSVDFFSMYAAQQNSSGSGIIFGQDSRKVYIATNYHVIAGASTVSVSIENSGDIPAAFVGSEPDSDLAVIAVSKTDIDKAGVKSVSIAIFGDSDQMKVGDPVVAIGNAMDEGNNVTSGIISASNKDITVDGVTLTVLQTDAAINPGNSGGPLINRYGEIIGINTAKFSSSDAEGMGYSIPSNIAKPIFDDIVQQIPKPFLGIQGVDLTQDMADIYNLPITGGVQVEEVVPGSSAQNAGIQRNDVITGFNGEAIFSMTTLSEAIQKCKVGDEVIVKVYRNGNGQMEFKVTLAEYKSDNF